MLFCTFTHAIGVGGRRSGSFLRLVRLGSTVQAFTTPLAVDTLIFQAFGVPVPQQFGISRWQGS